MHYFNKNTLQNLLTQLQPNKTPAWGGMTPQHMVEHLGFAVGLSNGKIIQPLYTPIEKLAKVKAYMMQPDWLPPVNFKVAFLPAEGLMPLRYANLSEALQALLHEIDDFYTYFEQNPDATPNHPYFGPLTKEEWLHNHNRHFLHHLKQFELAE